MCACSVRLFILTGLKGENCPFVYNLEVWSSWVIPYLFLSYVPPWNLGGVQKFTMLSMGTVLFILFMLLLCLWICLQAIPSGDKLSTACICCIVTQAVSIEPFIVWPRFCEPARLGVIYCLSVCLCSTARDVTIELPTAWVSSIDIGYWFTPLPDKLSAEDRSLKKEFSILKSYICQIKTISFAHLARYCALPSSLCCGSSLVVANKGTPLCQHTMGPLQLLINW